MFKKLSIKKLWSRTHKRHFNLLVEWTNCCNINCQICPIDLPGMRPSGHMSLERWKKILDDCTENGHYVNWVHHLGEPLLWRHFDEGMRLWKESGLSSKGHISTNGVLLDKKKIETIKGTNIEFIRICLDTLRPDVYRKIRNNDKHGVVIENIRDILESAPGLSVQIQLMRTNLNADEEPEEILEYFGRKKNLAVFYTTAMDLGKGFDFRAMDDSRADPRQCNKVDYEHCVIGWYGTVGLCCADYRLDNKLGNIKNLSISEVFDGEYANKIRRMIRQGDFSLAPACATCSMDHMKPLIRKVIGPS